MGYSFPLEDLRLLLDKAKAADTELKQFGARHHKYELNPPASLRDIENFEWAIGISLPEDYRNFLLQAGDGGAGPFYGLFSIARVQGWLGWDVEPDKTPYLRPDMDLKALKTEGNNWKRGCIPIESQGDTYFTCLMVTGPDRGRIVYVEYEGSWVFFPRQPDFMSWYTRWLRDVAAGYDLSWFGISLDGNEEDLRQHYIEACSQEERLLAITSMGKFPVLSKATQDFVRDSLEDWTTVEDIANLPELVYRVDPKMYEDFLDKRWKNGLYRQVLIALYHTPADKQALAERWRARILEKLPEVPTESYCITIPLLRRSGGVIFDQVSFWLDKAQGREKHDLLRDLGHLPDAKEHLDVWLPLLNERKDLDLLYYAIISVPLLNDSRLQDALHRIQKALPFAMERFHQINYQNEEEVKRSIRRSEERKVYEAASVALKDIFYETINPENENIPRPYRLKMTGQALSDLGMYQSPPLDGIPLHPLIVLTIQQEMNGRLPSTAWDWEQRLKRIKKLFLFLNDKTVHSWDNERCHVCIRAPGEHCPPPPYYFDLSDWSAIGRMESLRHLKISEICVEDFSFLTQCKKLRTLSLYNTNFSDCRLLLELPDLRSVDLRLCHLTHQEVLNELNAECEL